MRPPLLPLLSPRLLSRRFSSSKIIYTKTDEAPALATLAFLPVIHRFASFASIQVELSDISVSHRILSQFPHLLPANLRVEDTLAELGQVAKTPDANIVKLPNVSASVPQLTEAIAELSSKGYPLPPFSQSPSTPEEKEAYARYARVLGSAVNPVLREGNSDRRVARPVKEYARKNPHKMGKWKPDCRTNVAHMSDGDFYSSEQAVVVPAATAVRIEHLAATGATTVFKPETKLLPGELIDASRMSVAKLRDFYEETLTRAKADGMMVSLHVKATMMKVSDPILFGNAVSVFFSTMFEKHGDILAAAKWNPNHGLGELYQKLGAMSPADRGKIEACIAACYDRRPGLAMVDSARGITNLHVPSDVIIDASMPCVVRDSGKMWNKDDKLEDVICMIPDRCYATMYQAVFDDCRANGQFDVATMGSVSNVGLMAQKAQEYGSHDKTFEIDAPGTVRVVDIGTGETLMSHEVEKGDIWRMCQTKDEPIRDWVKLAVNRARATGDTAIFWLDKGRAHDAQLIHKVETYLKDHDTAGLDISIAKPVDAIKTSMARARAGKDTISVTGNVLRDYLTDLFPIIELGTSAKMLSIVPLLAGGGLFETGAGGSAPKHVQQFTKEGHLRWDSLGEYLALAVSLEDLGAKSSNAKATMLGEALNDAIGKLLDEKRSPSRKCGEIDNRGSTFYIAKYWAAAMAEREASFVGLAKELADNEEIILKELIDCQGSPVDIGGYWQPDPTKASEAMRPSKTFNQIIGD